MLLNCVLEKILESPLDCKEIKPVNPKGNQSWIFVGRTDAEAETPVLWPPDVKSWFIWKDPDSGKDWRQEEEMMEDEMVEWHHWLSGHELEQAPEVGDGQGSLACCSRWGCKESDTTERLNWLTDAVAFRSRLQPSAQQETESLMTDIFHFVIYLHFPISHSFFNVFII